MEVRNNIRGLGGFYRDEGNEPQHRQEQGRTRCHTLDAYSKLDYRHSYNEEEVANITASRPRPIPARSSDPLVYVFGELSM